MTTETVWPPHIVRGSRERIEELRDTVLDLADMRSDDNQYIISELSRMLVVRCSGHLEVTFSECFLAFVERHSKSTICNYVNKTFRNWQNPSPKSMRDALKNIDEELSSVFFDFVNADGGALSSDVGTMVQQRCRISHGDNDQVTFRMSQRYCEAALTVSEWIVECFKPNGRADLISSV